ncbi:MAG: 50S ribosomal protein L15e [Nanoarchaeota archaeon]
MAKKSEEKIKKKTEAKPAPQKPAVQKPVESQKGFYHFIREAWKKPDMKVLRERMTEWRKDNVIKRVDKPLRLDRARSLGYKAKKGFVVVRVRILRGGHRRHRPNKKRRSKRLHGRKNLSMNYKEIAEQRVARKYPNLEVLNSYQVGKDGVHYFFEVILVDPEAPEIKSDKNINWIARPENRGRVMRGLTSAGKKSRGLRDNSPTNKSRPSKSVGSI